MSRALPPLHWFRSFEAAARHLNVTAAAQELGLTQSAVSQHIRALEVRLGVQLFARKARGLSITDDGRKLLPQVGEALASLHAATAAFETGPSEQLLSIATSVSVAQWLLVPNIDRFLSQHSGLRIRLLSTIWPDEFKASIADVEIRFGAEKQVGDGATRLGPDRLVAVAKTPLDGPLEQQILIETVGTSSGWPAWSARAAVPHELAPSIYVDSYGLALDLARNGKGVALTSSLLARAAIRSGEVTQVHPAALESPEGYFLAAGKAPHAQAFAQWLQELVG